MAASPSIPRDDMIVSVSQNRGIVDMLKTVCATLKTGDSTVGSRTRSPTRAPASVGKATPTIVPYLSVVFIISWPNVGIERPSDRLGHEVRSDALLGILNYSCSDLLFFVPTITKFFHWHPIG